MTSADPESDPELDEPEGESSIQDLISSIHSLLIVEPGGTAHVSFINNPIGFGSVVGPRVHQASAVRGPAAGVAARRSAASSGSPAREVPRASTTGARSSGSAAPAASRNDLRAYCLFAVPGDPGARGIWIGPHPETWAAVASHLRGGQLVGSGAAIRRAVTEVGETLLEAAVRTYAVWGGAHRAPVPAVIHRVR
jgi:hypothetical protein